MSAVILAPATELPALRGADGPPEADGRRRDDVRLMVAWRASGRLEHARFRDLPSFLDPGDLVVVNTSATIAAAIDALTPDGTALIVHFSTSLSRDGRWVVEPRRAAGYGTSPWLGEVPGGPWALAGGGSLTVVAPYRDSRRLWIASVETGSASPSVADHLALHGRPIRYSYATQPWPLTTYETVYALEPGSAEMPSAGRPFTAEVITRLVARGVGVAPIVLHTGVASLEGDEEPYPEWFHVPATTARLVNATRKAGGRVVAVGTTVVRALESAGSPTVATEGWTDLVVGPERVLRVVDGLVTGWHEPAASHLRMLEAVAGGDLLPRSYSAAAEYGYLGHEFGDSHLILP